MQPYIHQVRGRIRVRSIAIKQQPNQVADLLTRLNEADGIKTITHKRYAGSVAVTYDATVVKADTLMAFFESHGLLREDLSDDAVTRLVANGGKLVGRTLITLAAQRVLGPKAASLLSAL